MSADFAFINDANRVTMRDQNWRLERVKSKYPKVGLVDFTMLKMSMLKEMVER